MKTVVLPLLKQQRESRCWTQETLAELAGIAVRTVQRAEKQEAVSMDAAMAIAGAMDFEDYRQLIPAETMVGDHSHEEPGKNLTPVQFADIGENLPTPAQATPDKEGMVFISADDKQFLDGARLRANLLAGSIFIAAVLTFIKESPNESAYIGMTLVLGFLIIVFTKHKEEGKSWWRSWSVNERVFGVVAGGCVLVTCAMVGMGLNRAFSNMSNELSLLTSIGYARDVTFILEDENSFQNISEDAVLRSVLSDGMKQHQALAEKIDKWHSIYLRKSESWDSTCLVLPVSNGKMIPMLDMKLGEVKDIFEKFAWDCSDELAEDDAA